MRKRLVRIAGAWCIASAALAASAAPVTPSSETVGAQVAFKPGVTGEQCEKYGADIKSLFVGKGTLTLGPVMSQSRGALDRTPPQEIGCQALVRPTNEQIFLGYGRPEATAEYVRTTKGSYENALTNGVLKSEPQLGAEGFSFLWTYLGARMPGMLIIVGHRNDLVVSLSLQRDPLSRTPIGPDVIDRARTLVRKMLADLK